MNDKIVNNVKQDKSLAVHMIVDDRPEFDEHLRRMSEKYSRRWVIHIYMSVIINLF